MARPRSDSPLLFEIVEKPDFTVETRAMAKGQWPVAGMDEAGRGPLAGPVVAAAVVLDPARIPEGLDDSKRLTFEQREALFERIVSSAIGVAMASVAAEGIEALKEVSGSVDDVLANLIGGVQSGMGYLGAATLAELRAKARYIRVSPAGQKEAAPHDVIEVSTRASSSA